MGVGEPDGTRASRYYGHTSVAAGVARVNLASQILRKRSTSTPTPAASRPKLAGSGTGVTPVIWKEDEWAEVVVGRDVFVSAS